MDKMTSHSYRIENVIKEPDYIKELAKIASQDKHRNAKNYENFHRRIKHYIAFHVIYDGDDVIGFGGIFTNPEWPSSLVRIVDRMWHHPSHRFKGLDQVGAKHIGFSSELLVPYQTEFCEIRRWTPFFTVEGVRRRPAVKKIVDNHIPPKYGYKLLPDMYYTCTGKDGVFYEGQCWQSVIAQGEVDLPKMSVENCKKILKGT